MSQDPFQDLDENYNPPPSEKIWYNHAYTSDEGWLVRRNGKDYIKLNRPNEDIVRPFNNGADWVPQHERRPFTVAQIVQVAFEADKTYMKMLGVYDEARKEWLSLRDDERIDFMERGPREKDRNGLWKAIMEYLRPLAK